MEIDESTRKGQRSKFNENFQSSKSAPCPGFLAVRYARPDEFQVGATYRLLIRPSTYLARLAYFIFLTTTCIDDRLVLCMCWVSTMKPCMPMYLYGVITVHYGLELNLPFIEAAI